MNWSILTLNDGDTIYVKKDCVLITRYEFSAKEMGMFQSEAVNIIAADIKKAYPKAEITVGPVLSDLFDAFGGMEKEYINSNT